MVKAYTTRVGAGPLPTEDDKGVGKELQSVGREWGTTTGRKRRCGILDLVLLRHTAAINQYTHLNLTKLDVLDSFKTIEVAVADHCKEADGTTRTWRDRLPADHNKLEKDRCQYETIELEGWKCDISSCRKWDDLPQKARDYVLFVEKEVGVRIEWIGVGADRNAMITRSG